MQKSRIIEGIILVILLVVCACDQRYKRHGNEEYLKSPSLYALTSPSDMILPLQNGDYEIPIVPGNGSMGKELDISPPT